MSPARIARAVARATIPPKHVRKFWLAAMVPSAAEIGVLRDVALILVAVAALLALLAR